MNASGVRHYRDLINGQTGLESAAMALAEAADALGWELAGFQIDISSAVAQRTERGEYLHHRMGWPAPYVQDWDARGMGWRCPVAQRCLDTMDTLFWTASAHDDIWRGASLQPEQRQVLDHYGDLLAGGITVPVRRAAGRVGYVSWCSAKADALHERSERSFATVFALSHAFIYRAEVLAAAQDMAGAPQLSEREIECLGWAARGKTEDEIARILFRSPATVHFHLRNAATKLDASNRTHAVAIASARGLIQLH
jgi:DNA-binding CsgD family transcriptional regulator